MNIKSFEIRTIMQNDEFILVFEKLLLLRCTAKTQYVKIFMCNL